MSPFVYICFTLVILCGVGFGAAKGKLQWEELGELLPFEQFERHKAHDKQKYKILPRHTQPLLKNPLGRARFARTQK